MISSNTAMKTTKPSSKLQNQKNLAMQQKEEMIQNVISTLKGNLKFLKLLVYSLNSMENLVSPPNRDIKLNAKIIIRLEGVDALKSVTLINIISEELLTKTGNIIWKIISLNDVIDPELAKQFVEKGGHEAIIEILLCKPKGEGSLRFISALNGLSQVPNLLNKLLESGLVETVKLVNDLYTGDTEVIATNFDTMKKISNQKVGREALIKKNLIPNLIKNMKICAKSKNSKAVISGFTVIDNLTRTDQGKDALKASNAVDNISQVLDSFENDDRVLKMGAKIYSKISKPDDILTEISNLTRLHNDLKDNPSSEKLKELEKSLVLVSNFMLVDDTCKLLCNKDNLQLLEDLFNSVCSIDLSNMTSEFIKTYVLLNKYFMVVFHRIFNFNPQLYVESGIGEESSLMTNINNSIFKNWENVKKIVEDSPPNEKDYTDSFIKAFREYFSSYTEIINENYQARWGKDKKIPDDGFISLVKYILNNTVATGKEFFDVDEKSNFAASRIVKIGSEISKLLNNTDLGLVKCLEDIFNYLKGVVNITDYLPTVSNSLDVISDVLHNVISLGASGAQSMLENVIPVIVHFMNTKPKFRYPNHVNLKVLDQLLTPQFLDGYLKNQNKNILSGNANVNPLYNLNYVNCIVSVMAKHMYQTSTVLKVVSGSDEDKEKTAVNDVESGAPQVDETLEQNINKLGASLLEKLVDVAELKKNIKAFKDIEGGFNPANANAETILSLEASLLFLYCIMNIKNYFASGITEVLEILKALIKKEIAFIENFKRDKSNESNAKYGEIAKANSKRLKLEITVLKMINDNCNKQYLETKSDGYIAPLNEVIATILEIFDKSTDSSNLIDLLSHLRKNISFLNEHEHSLKTDKNELVVEKTTSILMNLLRKSMDDEVLTDSLIKTFTALVKKKGETCNYLVKAGCPRLLLQVMEDTSDPKIANDALELIKHISLSSEENLIMMSNQNILEKLHEVRAKFVTDPSITKECDLIANEIMKLPGQEKAVTEIVTSSISELHDCLGNCNFDNAEDKKNCLSILEKINAFSSNAKQIELLQDPGFIKDLNFTISLTIKDPELSEINEKLLTNEMALLQKIHENMDTNSTDKDVIEKNQYITESTVDNCLAVIATKSNFRDIFLHATKIIADFINDDKIFEEHLEKRLETTFVDHLLDTSENYLDDPEVSKEINNILCNLCLKNETLADYIVLKGGLSNVMEELKSNVGMDDDASKQLKLNGLKFLDSLLKDDKNMEKFIQANGTDLINNLMKNELNSTKDTAPEDTSSMYHVRDLINTNIENERVGSEEAMSEDVGKNSFLVPCLEIIDKSLERGMTNFNDEKTIKNIVKVLETTYPNRNIFIKAMEILTKDGVFLPENEASSSNEDKISLMKTILSNISYFFSDNKVKAVGVNMLQKLDTSILDTSKETMNKDLVNAINEAVDSGDMSEINKVLTYTALSLDLNESFFGDLLSSGKEAVLKMYNHLLTAYGSKHSPPNENLSEGAVIAMMKLSEHLIKKKVITSDQCMDKLLQMGLNFYKPENYVFVNEFLNQFKKLFDAAGGITKYYNKFSEEFVNFLQNIYLRSFDFFDHYHKTLKSNYSYPALPEKVEENLTSIIDNVITYYKTDEDSDYKVSSAKKLTSSVLEILCDIDENIYENTNQKLDTRIKKMWEIVKNVLQKDNCNVVLGNEEVVTKILDKLNKTIESGIDDPALRDIYKIISSKTENNNEVFEKMIDFVSSDLTMATKLGEKDNDAIAGDLETIANLSRFPIVPKMILKNPDLFVTLKKMYSSKTQDLKIRGALATIFKNILKNNYNLETLISTDPELFTTVASKVTDPSLTLSSTNEEEKEIAKIEAETLIEIMKDPENYKLIAQRNLISEEDLSKGIQNYSQTNPEIASTLSDLRNQIVELNQTKKEEASFQSDTENVKSLHDFIKESFDQHMVDVSSYGSDADSALPREQGLMRNSTKMITTQSNVISKVTTVQAGKLSVISKTLFTNPDNVKIKSPLSCKDNCDIPTTIDNLLSFIRKLYNETKLPGIDPQKKKEREELISKSLQALKYLTVSGDNHKSILEMGLVNFLEKLIKDEDRPVDFYLQALDILKNCTWSENAIPVLLESPVIDKLIEEVVSLYENPDMIAGNELVRKCFVYANMNFSNLCKSKKGFEYLYKKIGMEKLIQLGKKTGNVDILTAIVEMLINYLQTQNMPEVNKNLLADIISIIQRCMTMSNKTCKLYSLCLTLIGMIYSNELAPIIANLEIISSISIEFEKYKGEIEFLNSCLFTLGIITPNNVANSREVISSRLLSKLKEAITIGNYNDNDILIENLTSLYKNLVLNNMENIENFCKIGIVINVFYWIEKFINKCQPTLSSCATINPNAKTSKELHGGAASTCQAISPPNQIILNCFNTLDSLTISDNAIAYLGDTKFSNLLFEILDKPNNDIEMIKIGLHCFGNYIYKEIGNNLKNINFERMYQMLKSLQKRFYSNSDISINLNYIAGYAVKICKERLYKEKFYSLISESIKCQDWNVSLVTMALKLMYDSLIMFPVMIDDVFEDSMQCLFNLLKLYANDSEVQIYCYRILTLFGKNFIYSYTIVNAGLMDLVKNSTENINFNENHKIHSQMREVIFNLLSVVTNDVNNAKKISDVLMMRLLKELKEDEFSQDITSVIRLLMALLKHKYCIQPFIQYLGLEAVLKILHENPTNTGLVFDILGILFCIADCGDEYKQMMINMKVPELINEIIAKSGVLDKKIEYEGRSLIFTINMAQKVKLEQVEDLNYVDIKVDNPIKPEVKNFLTSGKQVKMINSAGDVKSMQLTLSQDLLKISAKKLKSVLPPKPKYVLETTQIKQVVKGHGTEAFKKSKGFFRAIPKPEKCFTIIGPTTVDGVKALNVECENEDEVNKWISSLEVIINYLKKTKAIKSAVVIKK